MTRFRDFSLAVVAGLFAAHATAVAATSPSGVWLDHTGRGAVEIRSCGEALCGHIVWLQDKANSSLCGHQIIGNVRQVSRTTWDKGWIYSPERNSRFDVELRLLKSGKLRVLGYAGVKFLSETMIWSPAPADLQKCNVVAEDAAASTKVTSRNEQGGVESDEGKLKQPSEKEVTNPRREATVKSAVEVTGGKQGIEGKRTASVSPQPPTEVKPRTKKVLPDDQKPDGKLCKLDLPYISLTFPCPE